MPEEPDMPEEPGRVEERRQRTTGPVRLLIAVYALLAVAATSRAAVQISTKFDQAPVAYTLSAVAAVIYILATVALARNMNTVATLACSFELTGVLAVGVLSLIDGEIFPDATVWSDFGVGYGLLPLVLPVLALTYLRRRAIHVD
jgi:hypothetical protein